MPQNYDEDPEGSFPSDLDCSALTDYMARNGLSRMELTVESLDSPSGELIEARTALAVIERPAEVLSSSEPPHPDGLAGVFFTHLVDGE